jgi:hypothetical protein
MWQLGMWHDSCVNFNCPKKMYFEVECSNTNEIEWFKDSHVNNLCAFWEMCQLREFCVCKNIVVCVYRNLVGVCGQWSTWAVWYSDCNICGLSLVKM